MAMTGASAVGNGPLAMVTDPALSAFRVTYNPEQTGGMPISAPAGGMPVSAPAGGLPVSAQSILPVVVTAINNYTGGWLVSANSVTGTGATLTALRNGGGYGAGMYTLICTGNSASGGFYASYDGASWKLITATAMASGAITVTVTGQWSGYYPYLTWVNTWISAGANLTGTVWARLDLL